MTNPFKKPVASALGAILFAAPAVLLTLPAAAADSATVAPDTQVRDAMLEQILADISPQRIDAYIHKLVSFHTRHTASDTVSETQGIGAARRWIQAELERCSAQAGGRLKVTLDSYVQQPGPRLLAPTEIVNVVATLQGTQKQSQERL